MTLFLLARSIVCALLLVSSITSTIVAQEKESAGKVRLIAFSRVGGDLSVNIADAEGNLLTKESVPLPTRQLSPNTSLSSRKLVFLSPKNPETVLAKTTLPSSDREFILMFLPSPKGSTLPYIVHAVPLSLKGFGSGDFAFFNYSRGPIGFKIDKGAFAVDSGKVFVYQTNPKKEGNKSRAFVCHRKRKDGSWETTPFYSSRLIIQAGVRNLILIFQNPRNGKIAFRGIPDFIRE